MFELRWSWYNRSTIRIDVRPVRYISLNLLSNLIYLYRIVDQLLYAERPFYSFITDATNIAGKVGSVQTIIELTDIPNLPPTFTRAFGVQRFFEKVEMVNNKYE